MHTYVRLGTRSFQLDETVDLSAENAQALCDHGAAAPPPPAENTATTTGGGAGSGLATASGVATPMSVVSTTLHARIEDTDWTIDGVRSLIWPSSDADLEARDPEGMTVLLLAARHGRGHMVEALLAAGVDTGACDERGYTAVSWVRETKRWKGGERGRGWGGWEGESAKEQCGYMSVKPDIYIR